jgi:hypothetical protein
MGDRIRVGGDSSGVVVCSIDTDEYSSEFPREQWSYLGTGVMIQFANYGLVHYKSPMRTSNSSGALRLIACYNSRQQISVTGKLGSIRDRPQLPSRRLTQGRSATEWKY